MILDELELFRGQFRLGIGDYILLGIGRGTVQGYNKLDGDCAVVAVLVLCGDGFHLVHRHLHLPTQHDRLLHVHEVITIGPCLHSR
jgi:hypothetical protein